MALLQRKKILNFTHLDPKMGPEVISADFTAGPIKKCAPHFFKKVYKPSCADISKVQHISKWNPKISLFLNNPIFSIFSFGGQ